MAKPSDFIKKGWVQGEPAVDKRGVGVGVDDPKAVAWCLYGALLASASTDQSQYRSMETCILKKLLPRIDFISMVHWNDSPDRTQQEVIDLLESVGL